MNNKAGCLILTAVLFTCTGIFPAYAGAEGASPEAFSFAGEGKEIQFTFASGAGAWSTDLILENDGSFYGNFHDSDMGDSGEGYPYGTVYCCDFSGAFTDPVKVDEFTYAFRIREISCKDEPGNEEYMDGVRYIYSEPYGLNDAEDFYLYLPGAPLSSLPEDFLGWTGYHDLSETTDTVFPRYGLYNANAGEGFSGYPYLEVAADDAMGEMIATAEYQGFLLENQLHYEDLPQMEMNQKSGELFDAWDRCLNEIWGYLKETLDPDAMTALTQEELQWIADKEEAVREAGKDYEGGSIQPLVMNSTAADWTKERVYVLYGRYGQSEHASSQNGGYGAVA